MQKHHILLNDKGFLIQDETYHKKLQPPFPPRFSMKEGNYNDLSFFTFYQMNDFQGGEGEDKVLSLTPNSFKESLGLNTLDPGEVKLSPKIEQFADLSHIQEELSICEYGDKIILYGAEGIGLTKKPFSSSIISVKTISKLVEPASQKRLFSLNKIWDAGITGDDYTSELDEVGVIHGTTMYHTCGWRVYHALRGFTMVPWEYFGTRVIISIPHELYWPGFWPWKNQEFYCHMADDAGDVWSTDKRTDTYENGYLLLGDSSGEVIQFAKLVLQQQFKITEQTFFRGSSGRLALRLHKRYTCNLQGIRRGQLGTTAAGHLKYTPVYLYTPARYEEVTVNSEFVPRAYSSCIHNNQLVLGCEGIIRSLLEVDGKLAQQAYRNTTISDDDNDLVRTVDAVCAWDATTVIAAIDGNLLYRVGLNATGTGEFTLIGSVAGINKIVKIIVHEQMIWYAGYGDNWHSVIGTTDGTSIIQPIQTPPMQISDLVSWGGLLCFSGKTSSGKGVLYGYPDVLMLEMEEPGEDCGIREMNPSSGFLFIPQNHGLKIQALTTGKEGQPGGIACYVSLPKTAGQAGIISDLEWYQDSIYFVTRDNKIWKSNSERYITEGYLITSKFYGEAELQDKIWFSTIIELKENLPLSCKIDLYSKRIQDDDWVILGSFMKEEISHEFFFPEDYNSKAIQLKVVMQTENERETAIITSLTIRHVLTSLNKFVWAFTIRATNNLKLLNQKIDTRTGDDIRNELLDICKDQKVINFTDLDGAMHRVIITDMDITSPLIAEGKQEGLISLEILEA